MERLPKQKTKTMGVRVPVNIYNNINATAKANGISLSDVIWGYLSKGMEEDKPAEVIEVMDEKMLEGYIYIFSSLLDDRSSRGYQNSIHDVKIIRNHLSYLRAKNEGNYQKVIKKMVSNLNLESSKGVSTDGFIENLL